MSEENKNPNQFEEEDDEEEMPELAKVAFGVIMEAGDAKLAAEKALEKLHKFDFDGADALFGEAAEHLRKAHNAQTEVVQSEISGTKYENSFLFNHAQDTLMTAMTQLTLSKEICALYQILWRQIKAGSDD